MSRYRRADVPSGTYFFTVVSFRRQRFLCDADVRLALRQAIRKTQVVQPFVIDAWVLLPDHLHCIWTLPKDDADFGGRWANIKRFVTRQCKERLHREEWMSVSKKRRQESTIWQRRFWEHFIHDEYDYRRHMDYVHWNPVKHGHVTRVCDWPYSSFHRYVKNGVYSRDWGGENINSVDGSLFGE